MRKRIAYSQNFLWNKGLVAALVSNSSLKEDDIVYEIGAGQGIITEALVKRCKKVVAFEIDENLYRKLNERFKNMPNVEFRLGDFLA